MRRRDVHVEDEVRVLERALQVLVEEPLDLHAQGPHRVGEEVVVVEVALAEAEEGAGADETAELERGGERGDGFAEDEVVGDLFIVVVSVAAVVGEYFWLLVGVWDVVVVGWLGW